MKNKIIAYTVCLVLTGMLIAAGTLNGLTANVALVYRALVEKNFTIAEDRSRVGEINIPDWYTYKILLYSGNCYAVVGVGDETVQDVDLVLYDENGNEVSKDVDNEHVAVVENCPAWTGIFHVKVRAYRATGRSAYIASLLAYK